MTDTRQRRRKGPTRAFFLSLLSVLAAHLVLFLGLDQWRQTKPAWDDYETPSTLELLILPRPKPPEHKAAEVSVKVERAQSTPQAAAALDATRFEARVRATTAPPRRLTDQLSVPPSDTPPLQSPSNSGDGQAIDRGRLSAALKGGQRCRLNRSQISAEERQQCDERLGATAKESAPLEGGTMSPEARAEFELAWKEDHSPAKWAQLGCFARFGQGRVVTYKPTRGFSLGPCFFATPKATLQPVKPKAQGFD